MFKIAVTFFLMVFSTLAFSHGMSADDQARILNAGNMEYMQLGASHMLSGYDHLLFLFGVMFFLTQFKQILKVITAFTIGHSITLILATFMQISANYYLVDAVIALTVCYKAFDNLNGFKKYLHMVSPNLVVMVFVFGLIHGFGLSTRLQQLPLGDDGLLMKILSFNLGVELGQVIALSIMLLLLAGWRKTQSFTRFSQVSNVVLLVLGGLLLLMQLHAYEHSQFADEFPLNRDDHSHAHEDMAAQESALKHYPKKLNFNASMPLGDTPSINPETRPEKSDIHNPNKHTNSQQNKASHSHPGEAPHVH